MFPVNSRCLLIHVVFVIYIISEAKYHFLIASNSTEKYDVECAEMPPNCSGNFKWEYGAVRDFYVSDNEYLKFIRMEYDVDSSHTECRFDPFLALQESHDVSLDDVNIIHINIDCHTSGTRLVSALNISSQAMVSIRTRHCSLYWKDISAIGISVNLTSLELEDWNDEFASGESAFFTKCVKLQNSSVVDETGRRGLVIAGLSNVHDITMEYRSVRSISPVLTHYEWPKMVEFFCGR